MRRLLVPFLLVAATVSPASAAEDICFAASTHGTAIPNRSTGTTCTVNVYPWGMYCETGVTGVDPDAWVEHQFCTPTLIPFRL